MTARSPAHVVPLLYAGTAHAALALAAALVVWSPQSVAGFFYHSWMIAIVHLVTLGWITCSILGSIFIVGPMTLGFALPARRLDYAAFGCVLTGLVGMVAHFWIQEFGGMAWSAATATVGVLHVVGRVAVRIPSARVAAGVKLHLGFACVNVALAASMGVLLGFDKAHHFLPGFVMSNVFAHAHLAAIGWATMMVVGTAYRLLPMTLPAPMPAGRSIVVSALLLEGGVLGLFVALLAGSRWTPACGAAIGAGLFVFGADVARMVRSRSSSQAATPWHDFAVAHAAGAGLSLLLATVLGLALLVAPASPRMLRVASAYGALGLVGFLAQMVAAMQARLIPMLAWYWRQDRHGAEGSVPPAVMRDRWLQEIVFGGWAAGAPLLAAGFFLESPAVLRVAAWLLGSAVAAGALDNVFVMFHVRGRRPERDRPLGRAKPRWQGN